jgi:hypothetical protein
MIQVKKLLLAFLLAAVASTQATVIEWSASNDLGGGFPDAVFHDGVFTGFVTDVAYNNGAISTSDALEFKFAVIDLNTNMFYLSTNNAAAAATAVLSANFGFDISSSNFQTVTGYTLTNLVVNNTIGSIALDEFAQAILVAPAAQYKFSFIAPVGNGQLATVPEPTTLGLMGLGILGLAIGARRRKK